MAKTNGKPSKTVRPLSTRALATKNGHAPRSSVEILRDLLTAEEAIINAEAELLARRTERDRLREEYAKAAV